MARSLRYRTLGPRLTELRRHMLPIEFDPTTPYSDRQNDRILGYRLLAHAELEACIEDLVVETVSAAWKGWLTDSKPRTCLTALVAFYSGDLGGPPSSLTPGQPKATQLIRLQDRIDKARNHHVNHVVRQNHGVREKNLLALLLPVGVTDGDLNKTWLATIDSFGRERGGTAHRSGRTQQRPDPERELVTVLQIAEGLKDLDERLGALRHC